MKPLQLNSYTYICPKCKTKVGYIISTGNIIHTNQESYEDWHFKKNKFCPECGIRLDWEEDE